MKNLYRLTQDVNNDYDTYDSCIVCAKSEDDARRISPNNYYAWGEYSGWAYKVEDVKVEHIGVALPHILLNSVVIASFNAG